METPHRGRAALDAARGLDADSGASGNAYVGPTPLRHAGNGENFSGFCRLFTAHTGGIWSERRLLEKFFISMRCRQHLDSCLKCLRTLRVRQFEINSGV